MTTEQETTTEKEVKRIFRLLNTTARLAEHASLTGALSGGEKRCIRQYNNALNRLAEIGAVSEGLFDPVEEGAPFGEVGVACKLLAAYLEDEFDDESDEPSMGETLNQARNRLNRVRNRLRNRVGASVDEGVDLKDLGELIRQALPDFLKKELQKEGLEGEVEVFGVPSMAELSKQVQALAEQLRRNDISPEEIQRLADEMRKLAEQQALLARQRSTTEE
ncbi:hypothetical protein HYR99_06825 [Candidatus Poribacteria bacterium]|nr:hypothetical protein [Candidatus Poribacteria bacterium]